VVEHTEVAPARDAVNRSVQQIIVFIGFREIHSRSLNLLLGKKVTANFIRKAAAMATTTVLQKIPKFGSARTEGPAGVQNMARFQLATPDNAIAG
jgi:hypothetical protein